MRLARFCGAFYVVSLALSLASVGFLLVMEDVSVVDCVLPGAFALLALGFRHAMLLASEQEALEEVIRPPGPPPPAG